MKSHSFSVPPGKVKQFRCAFFNFTAEEANQTGGWSYRGVETHVINTTHVRCIASHLTSFVVLVSIVPSVGEPVSGIVLLIFNILLNCLPIYTSIHIHTSCFNLPTFSFTSACTELHHIHWLQHFITLFACIHYILFNTEVSPKIYNRFDSSHSLRFRVVCVYISSEKS